MQSTLILFLNNYHEGILSWVELEDNIVKQTILAGEVSSLAEVTKDKTIIVMVPATDILLTSVVMPNLSSSKLRQALPFALEDQLVGEIDQLHFAIGEKTDTALSVAIIQKDKIQHWLQLLREWQVYPHAMYAMVFGLPCEINTWSLLASDDECLVRLSKDQGFACDKSSIAVLLAAALKTSALLPNCVQVYSLQQKQSLSLQLPAEIEIQEETLSQQQLLEMLASHVIQSPGINLLQYPYASRKTKLPQVKKIWKMAAVLGGICLALLFLQPLVSYFILKGKLNQIDAQINQIYHRNFPQSTEVVAVQLRMEEKLKKYGSGKEGDKALWLLAQISNAYSHVQNVKINRLEVQNDQVNLLINAQSTDDVTGFSDQMTKLGLQVKQQNTTFVESRVNVGLQVT